LERRIGGKGGEGDDVEGVTRLSVCWGGEEREG